MHCDQIVPVLVPSHFSEKLKFLCNKIDTKEWSGVLFYRALGEFGTPGFKCLLEDILIMDIGTESRTRYRFEGVNCFVEENPVLRSARIGLIHSHNTMPVFFSSIDDKELSRNSKKHCYYLSVIVNNAGDMLGRFCYMADSVEKYSQTLSVKLGLDKRHVRTVIDGQQEWRVLCIHDCEFQHYNSHIDEAFIGRYEALLAEDRPSEETSGVSDKLSVSQPASTEKPVKKSRKGAQLDFFGDKSSTSNSRRTTRKAKPGKKNIKLTSSPGGGKKTRTKK